VLNFNSGANYLDSDVNAYHVSDSVTYSCVNVLYIQLYSSKTTARKQEKNNTGRLLSVFSLVRN